MLRFFDTREANFANNTAQHNSKRGMDSGLIGATRVFEHTIDDVVLWLELCTK